MAEVLLEHIYGTFLRRGIFNDNNLEYGFIDRVYISPEIWADAPADVIANAPKNNRKALFEYCRQNTEGIFLGHNDNLQLYDITIKDAKTGIPYFPHFSALFSANFVWACLPAVRVGRDV